MPADLHTPLPAPAIITDRVTAACRAGRALRAIEEIRDSTLPGTTLHDACLTALAGIDDVLGELYRP